MASEISDMHGGRQGERQAGGSDLHGGARGGGERLSEVKFLTVAEVAQVMRVSKMTVYRLVHSGELPAVRVGRSFRVPEQAVQDYLRDAYVNDVA
jgi:excisionase family DNA binding protein